MGTGIRLTLSFAELKKQYIPIPPIEEQQAIVDYIEAKLSKIDSCMADLQAEIDYLKEFKQRLISDVVTGQICVANHRKESSNEQGTARQSNVCIVLYRAIRKGKEYGC